MSKAAELANLIGNINAGGGGANKNVIINGAMNVAQRATSATGLGSATGYNVCDRWVVGASSTNGRLTLSQDSSAPSGFANSLKFDCTTADTSIASGENLNIQHRIEGQNLQAFAKGTSDAKPFALSFYVKGNASATYVAELYDGDNNRQISKTFSVTTDWTRVELTYPADTTGAFNDDNALSLYFLIHLHAGSTYSGGTLNSSSWASVTDANRAVGISSFFDSTDRTFFITGVQLEVGQNPTSFEIEPFDVTLEKCRRYYQQTSSNVQSSGFVYDNHPMCTYRFPVTMRTAPTVALISGAYPDGNSSDNGGLSQKSGYGAIGYGSPTSASFNTGTEYFRFFYQGGSFNSAPTEYGQGCMGNIAASMDAEL